jgi:hypothetical protein
MINKEEKGVLRPVSCLVVPNSLSCLTDRSDLQIICGCPPVPQDKCKYVLLEASLNKVNIIAICENKRIKKIKHLEENISIIFSFSEQALHNV